MINLTSLGGKYKVKDGNETVLVTVMNYNTTAVKFLLQRCPESGAAERIVHRIIVDKADDESKKLVGEQKQMSSETCPDQLLIKRMEVSNFKGFSGRLSVEIKVDEFRFPRSVAELTNLPEKYRKCFSSTYLFKLEKGKLKLNLTLHDCYRGWEIIKEFFKEDDKYRKYEEPTMSYHAKILLTANDVKCCRNDQDDVNQLMPSEDDFIFALVAQDESCQLLASADDDSSLSMVTDLVKDIIEDALSDNTVSQRRVQKLPKKRKYFVEKNIVFKEKFCEVHYKAAKDNFFIGKWIRSGTSVRETPSNREILCNSCHGNFAAKLKKMQNLSETLSEDSNGTFSAVCNYQVEGWTNPHNRYEWENNSCKNMESCWGEKEWLLTFQRKKTSATHTQYKFTQFKVYAFDNQDKSVTFIEKDVNTIYFHVEEVDRLRQEGIGLITLKASEPFIWPDLHKDIEDGEYYYHIAIYRNGPVHPDFKDGSWPTDFNFSRWFKYPTLVDIKFYKANPAMPKPTSEAELALNHQRTSLTCLNIYPGGSGMECKQWKFLKKDNCRNVYREKHVIREQGEVIPASWVDSDYIGEKGTFIPGLQDGFSGPIVTYFERLDNKERWFQ